MVATVLFYIFAALAVIGALSVVTSRNPVRAVISLIFTFVMAACVWMLLQVEFLALLLIVVYVGAVMVLFMFVVMMLDVDQAELKAHFVKYWPLAAVMAVLLLAAFVWAVNNPFFGLSHYPMPKTLPADYSSVKVLGMAMFTHYLYAFIVAGFILLAAMIAAITLTFRGRRDTVRGLEPKDQIKVNPQERLKMVNMPTESSTKGEV